MYIKACNSETFLGGVMIIVITSNGQDISGSVLEQCFRVEHVECEQMFQWDNGKFFRVLQQMLQTWCGLIFSMSV